MPLIPVRGVDAEEVRAGMARIRDELELPEGFSPEVLAEAEQSAAGGGMTAGAADLRHLPFVTIDPPGAQDLDQAVAFELDGGHTVVHYAIADVAAFVVPGGAVDAEAMRRVVTTYLPDGKVPLHPPVLSEDGASLLPGQDRPALVWHLRVDGAGGLVDIDFERAVVRSRAALDYATVQAAADEGRDVDGIDVARALQAVGTVLLGAEEDRGGVSLAIPDQEIDTSGERWRLVFRAQLPAERWNAQISLLAGRAGAQMMIDAGRGIVRTLPEPDGDDLATFRREVSALGVAWPDRATYAEVIRTLDPTVHEHAALLVQAVRLFRGASYQAFEGSAPEEHAAVAAPYAHVTAPIRRLVDRFANEIVLAHCEGRAPGEWALAALPDLPGVMDRGRGAAGTANRMAIDLMEAAVLARRVGETVQGVVVDRRGDRTRVQLLDPAVVADVEGADGADLGDLIDVRVDGADVPTRKVRLSVA